MRITRRLRGDRMAGAELIRQIRRISLPLRRPQDLDHLLHYIGKSRFVLLGEATHGTAEYYTWRADISRRLIREYGFTFIAVEGDWPDCYRVNRYVKGYADAGTSAREVLHAFNRWPTWMWANHEIVALTEWLRVHNDGLLDSEKIGFYGLDVYSLWDSLYQVMGYLRQHDPSALATASQAFQCFEPHGEDVQEYARATMWDESCEKEVVALLGRLQKKRKCDTSDGRDAHFNAEQNALVVKNAEHYYRTMVRGGPESWNIRDHHMHETLERLMQHHGPSAKAIVWEHNTHVGDARFTDMAEQGEVNVGELVRENNSQDDVALVGFGSYRGSVIAGRSWEAPMECMTIPPARPGSWEEILHEASAEDKVLLLSQAQRTPELLERRGHRAIGVVYHPEYEQYGNYVPTVLPRRYDAFLFLDHTHALHPLHDVYPHHDGEVPETFPSGV